MSEWEETKSNSHLTPPPPPPANSVLMGWLVRLVRLGAISRILWMVSSSIRQHLVIDCYHERMFIYDFFRLVQMFVLILRQLYVRESDHV